MRLWEEATEAVPAVSETSDWTKRARGASNSSEVAAGASFRTSFSEPTAEIASWGSLKEPVNAASETVEAASAPAEKAEDAGAAAKAIEKQNKSQKPSRTSVKTLQKHELPAREVVSAEELVQEPVQAKAAGDWSKCYRDSLALTSLEAELAALGSDTIDDEPGWRGWICFLSAEDVADANTSAVEENNEA